MSRDWAKVYAVLADHPKWMLLSPLGRGAWITLFVIGVRTEGRFISREQVDVLLRRDGFDAGALDELVQLGFVDVDDDGSILMHDWLDHQVRWRGPSDDPEAKAARNRELYNRRQRVSASVSECQRVSATEELRVEERREDTSRAPARGGQPSASESDEARWATFEDPVWEPFKAAWGSRGLRLPPTESQREGLWPIADARPRDLAVWVRRAPKGSAASVVGYVWLQFNAMKDDLPSDDQPDRLSDAGHATERLGEILARVD